MTEPTWENWTPQYDGHAPDDWDGGEVQYLLGDGFVTMKHNRVPKWWKADQYRYHPMQDATHEPDLLAQCLALPQADRDALIEALQKPVRDWADEVWSKAHQACMMADVFNEFDAAAAVIRSMCRPKDASSIRLGNTVAYEKEKP
jgi:hypothetical protein